MLETQTTVLAQRGGVIVASARTRIAPTPSGYLHLGNVLHILIVDDWAKTLGLDVHLRIDNFDPARVRPEYVADIFRVLGELDITWNSGPRSAGEVDPLLTAEAAWRELCAAQTRGLATFTCACSRRTLASGQPCRCRDRELAFRAGATSLRLDAPGLGLPPTMDGETLWRRDNLPGYHVVSVVVDRSTAITHVMRGRDLESATAVQQAIAPYFKAHNVAGALVQHHPLVTGPSGAKLSKSAGARAAPLALPPIEKLRSTLAHLLAGDG